MVVDLDSEPRPFCATLKGEGDPLNDGYFFVKDRLFIVTDFLSAMMALQGGAGQGADDEEEAEPMEIISYRLPLERLELTYYGRR